MRACLVVLLLPLAACGPSAADARDLQRGLDAIAGADSDMRVPLLAKSCSEIKSCGGACTRALDALPSLDPSERGVVLAHDCPDFLGYARSHANDQSTVGEWVRDYVSRYVARARTALDGAERDRLDAAAAKLGLAVIPSR